MKQSQCPICYSPLEVRDVTPCFICGGWVGSVARFEPSAEFREYRLPSGQLIVLCRACWLEEFMTPSGWGNELFPDEKLPVNALQIVRTVENLQVAQDKFCATCNRRLALLKVIENQQDQS